jgi:hypothetical protein
MINLEQYKIYFNTCAIGMPRGEKTELYEIHTSNHRVRQVRE